MLENFIRNATHIYFVCGATDFRKQTESLASLVSAQFKLDPYLQDKENDIKGNIGKMRFNTFLTGIIAFSNS